MPTRAAQSRGRCCSSPWRRRRCPASRPCRLHVPRAQQHDGVAVDDVAAGDRRRWRGRRRRRTPRPCRQPPSAHHCARDVPGAWSRSRRLMLRPFGASPITVRLESQLAEQARRHSYRRAVGAVDREPHRAEARRIGQRDAGVRDVGVHDVGAIHGRRMPAGHVPGAVARRSPPPRAPAPPVNFSPRPRNTLDAVVLERIVRRARSPGRRRNSIARVT